MPPRDFRADELAQLVARYCCAIDERRRLVAERFHIARSAESTLGPRRLCDTAAERVERHCIAEHLAAIRRQELS